MVGRSLIKIEAVCSSECIESLENAREAQTIVSGTWPPSSERMDSLNFLLEESQIEWTF